MSSFRMHERMGPRPSRDEQNGTRRFHPADLPQLVTVWVDAPTGGYYIAVHASELAKPVLPTSVTFADRVPR